MYERISAKRLRDRISKRNKNVKNKNEKYTIEQLVPALEEADRQPNQEETTENCTDVFRHLEDELYSPDDDIPFR